MNSKFIESNSLESNYMKDSKIKARRQLLLLVSILVVAIALGVSCNNSYGRKTHLDHLTIFNTSLVSDSLADKFLVFFNKTNKYSQDISIQLDFENGRYKIKAPIISETILIDFRYTQEFSTIARLISDSVFNSSPTDFVATDKHFKSLKTFPMETTFLMDSLNRLQKNDKYIEYRK